MSTVLQLRSRDRDTTVEALPSWVTGPIEARLHPFRLGSRIRLLPVADGLVVTLDLIAPDGANVWAITSIRPGRRWQPRSPLRGRVGEFSMALRRGIEADGGEVLELGDVLRVAEEWRSGQHRRSA